MAMPIGSMKDHSIPRGNTEKKFFFLNMKQDSALTTSCLFLNRVVLLTCPVLLGVP